MQIHLWPVLRNTLKSVFYPQVFFLFFLPFGVATILVATGIWLSLPLWTDVLQRGFAGFDPYWQQMINTIPGVILPIILFLKPLFPFLVFIVGFFVSFPLVFALNLLITSIVVSSYLVKFIARKEFPNLEARGNSRFWYGVWNSTKHVVLFLIAWAISFPFWFLPGAQLAIPELLTAWLNREVCTFDAATEFATDEELLLLKKETQTPGYVLGLVTAGINFIPFGFFVSPVLTMVAYTYMSLQALETLRLQRGAELISSQGI